MLTFLAYMYKKGMSHSSMNLYLSAIRNMNILNGHVMPGSRAPRIKLLLKAVFESSKQPTQKDPITWDILIKLWPAISVCKDSSMWQALISLAFFGSMRVSEYAPDSGNGIPPSIANVTFSSNGSVLHYRVPRSKTSAHGFVCVLACSHSHICALCCMVSYLGLRSISQKVSQNSPLFVDSNNQAIGSSKVNRFIKSIVKSIGLDDSKFSAHSIRAGAATTAAQAGFADWELKRLGGWKSSTYTTYIRNSPNHTLANSRRLARGGNMLGPTS